MLQELTAHSLAIRRTTTSIGKHPAVFRVDVQAVGDRHGLASSGVEEVEAAVAELAEVLGGCREECGGDLRRSAHELHRANHAGVPGLDEPRLMLLGRAQAVDGGIHNLRGDRVLAIDS
eukprot:12177316-Alexandrium_andersonii.AAC.1